MERCHGEIREFSHYWAYDVNGSMEALQAFRRGSNPLRSTGNVLSECVRLFSAQTLGCLTIINIIILVDNKKFLTCKFFLHVRNFLF